MDINHFFLPPSSDSRSKKDERQRLAYYIEWLASTNRSWSFPELDAYRDYLLDTRKLKPSSALAHLSTIKSRYRTLLLDHEELMTQLRQIMPSAEEQVGFAIKAMQAATSKEAGHIEYERNIEVFHLDSHQIDELLSLPNLATRQGLRDITAMGMMYCAGITETELCSLQVADLYHEKDGLPAIRVPKTPGGQGRHAPFRDDLLFNEAWVQGYVNIFLGAMKIERGRLYEGFFRGGQILNGKSWTVRGVQKMLKGYPIHDSKGNEFTVTALDLRRTYARRVFMAKVDFDIIHQDLGNVNQRTTMEYIGLPPLSKLRNAGLGDGSILLSRLREYWGF